MRDTASIAARRHVWGPIGNATMPWLSRELRSGQEPMLQRIDARTRRFRVSAFVDLHLTHFLRKAPSTNSSALARQHDVSFVVRADEVEPIADLGASAVAGGLGTFSSLGTSRRHGEQSLRLKATARKLSPSRGREVAPSNTTEADDASVRLAQRFALWTQSSWAMPGVASGKLERAKGFEPSTPTLARSCSTPELHPHPLGTAARNARAAKAVPIAKSPRDFATTAEKRH